MLKNSKNKSLIIAMGITTAISVGLFSYQNFYLNNKNSNAIIYVAKDNINSDTKLTEDMFEPISIPENGVLSSYITDISQVNGKELRGGLLKNEPITATRLTNKMEKETKFELKLEPDITIPVAENDYINVYVVLIDRGGQVNVQKIFDGKQVSISTVKDNDSTSQQCLTVKVNEDEIKDYYNAKEKGKIVIVKDDAIDGSKDITNPKYDPTSSEVQNAVKSNNSDNSAISVVNRKVEEGDTIDSLAIKYNTTRDKIINLNGGKTEFNVGDTINVPAN